MDDARPLYDLFTDIVNRGFYGASIILGDLERHLGQRKLPKRLPNAAALRDLDPERESVVRAYLSHPTFQRTPDLAAAKRASRKNAA